MLGISNLLRFVTHLVVDSRIYIELSDQYKEMDAISNVVKRNVVAQHLKEVIDVLEQKVRKGLFSLGEHLRLTEL